MSGARALSIMFGSVLSGVCLTPLVPDNPYGVVATLGLGAGVGLTLLGLAARDD